MKYTLLFPLLLLWIDSPAQVLKYRAKQFVVYKFNNVETHNKFDDVDFLYTLDLYDHVMKVFSPKVQRYDIIKMKSGKDNVFVWTCVDNDGRKCEISLLRTELSDHHVALIIEWSNVIWMFLMDDANE